MTQRERIEAAFAHREPDRTPCFEYVLLAPVADDLLGRPYTPDPTHWPNAVAELGWRNAVRRAAEDRLDLATSLGHDMLYVTPNPLPPAQQTPPRRTTANAATSDDPVERIRARNRVAAHALPPPDTAFEIYADLKQSMRQRGVDLPILAPAYKHGVWTDVDLMQTMLLAPDAAHQHFQYATQKAFTLVERYAALDIDMIGVGGDFAGNRLLISPTAYREFIVPQVRRVSERVHAAGARAVNASDGDLWPVIADFIEGCGADGYLEIDRQAGMDLRRLKQEWGNRVTFLGNLDCGNMLSFGTAEQIAEHVRECVDAGRGSGGHILCASNAITASVPLANYLTAVNTYRQLVGLPKLTPPQKRSLL
jgi:hypothetical protein